MKRLLTLLPLALGGCLAPYAPPQAPTRPSVVLFGDSNAKMAEAAARPLWGDVAVSYNAIAGHSIDDWAPEMAEVPDGAIVIVALGANDILEHDEAVEVDAHNATTYLAGARCIVWVTVNEAGFDVLGLGDEARAFNDWVRTEDGIEVQDWSAHSGAAVLGPDHIHNTAAGTRAYARELVEAKELCA